MAPSKVRITTDGTPITPCASSPQLMPFHIAYSGPAPIATFFRVRELEEDSESPSAPSFPPSSSSRLKGDGTTVNGLQGPAEQTKPGVVKRLVAAFRGRRVVGVEMPLPEGYTGLILQSDAAGKTNQTQHDPSMNGNGSVNGRRRAPLTQRRGTRRSKPVEIRDGDLEEMDGLPSDMMQQLDDSVDVENEEVTKTLKATQTFRSLVIWNADVAVDEGQDEYIRALREWTAVASEIHRMED